MWASIEKWAYPEWTFPLFIEHPEMSLNYDVAFFMRAAGVIEFTLAFALLWTPLVRRSAAIVLAGIFHIRHLRSSESWTRLVIRRSSPS